MALAREVSGPKGTDTPWGASGHPKGRSEAEEPEEEPEA